MPILKLTKHNRPNEIAFELKYLLSLTTKDRFKMMLEKSREMKDLLRRHGHRNSPKVFKRT